MRITEANLNTVSAVAYTALSLLAALVFLAITLATDYDWVARLGGAAWVFALAMVIFMPTLPALLRERVTGEKAPPMSHDHDAMLREEAMQEERSSEMVKDLVCGMEIDPNTAAGTSEYKGQTYYFCNLSCKKSFDADPEKYVNN